ncbi:MAG TPA: nuclear transport factor 2 family protein [Longimicrobiales bacterium]|nr:nuclear transport factor 2 family protein [Longimicrobiales bacterium]
MDVSLADNQVEAEVVRAAHSWDAAMINNNPEDIGAFMAEEWTIIGPDGSVGDRSEFLELVRSGALTHNVMESHEIEVRVYGEAAVLTARGVSGGHYRGEPFHLVERVSNVFVRRHDRWICVLTHLSLIGHE